MHGLAQQLHRAFSPTRFGRRRNQAGYVRFRHWRLYGQLGLSGQQTAVWLYQATLTLEFAEEPLSPFAVEYQPDTQYIWWVTDPRRFEPRFRSPQYSLWAD